MKNKPLTKKEFKKLNCLLSKQCNIDLNFIDGVITSAISSPELIKPSQYISLFCNENEGLEFDEEEQAIEFYELLFRHHNSIIHDINTSSTYKILSKLDDKEFSLSQWCKGYLLCLDLYHSSVTEKLPDVSDDVETIEKYSASNVNTYNDQTISNIRKELSSIAVNLYHEFRSINPELGYDDIDESCPPLTTEELNFVTNILTQYQTKDSIKNIYELDGFVVGLLTHIFEFDEDEIIDAIWNYSDENPNWSIDEGELFLALFKKWTDYHAQQLIEYPDEYQPLYLTAEADKQFEHLQSWSRGYIRGIGLFYEETNESFQLSLMEILKILVLLTGYTKESQEFLAVLKPKDKLELILNVRNVTGLLFDVIGDLIEDEEAPPFFDKPEPSAQAPKIGRNDPCFCGSGKKYKKCCLH